MKPLGQVFGQIPRVKTTSGGGRAENPEQETGLAGGTRIQGLAQRGARGFHMVSSGCPGAQFSRQTEVAM